METHMGDEKVLVAAIEFLQNLLTVVETNDILIQKVNRNSNRLFYDGEIICYFRNPRSASRRAI